MSTCYLPKHLSLMWDGEQVFSCAVVSSAWFMVNVIIFILAELMLRPALEIVPFMNQWWRRGHVWEWDHAGKEMRDAEGSEERYQHGISSTQEINKMQYAFKALATSTACARTTHEDARTQGRRSTTCARALQLMKHQANSTTHHRDGLLLLLETL